LEKSPDVFENGKIFAGLNKAVKLIESGKAGKVYLATDADCGISSRINSLCAARGVEVVSRYDRRSLGKHCGISVGCAVAVVLKD